LNCKIKQKLKKRFPNFIEDNILFVDEFPIKLDEIGEKSEIIIENKMTIKLKLTFCYTKEKLLNFEKKGNIFKDTSVNELHLILKNLEEKTSLENIKEEENSKGVHFKGFDYIECLNNDIFVSIYEISFIIKFKFEKDVLEDFPLFSTKEKQVLISTFYTTFIGREDEIFTTKTPQDIQFELSQVLSTKDWNYKIVTYSGKYLKEYLNGVLFSNIEIQNSIKDSFNVKKRKFLNF
jgi:hypothetical protein